MTHESEKENMPSDDRQASILTSKQREFLRTNNPHPFDSSAGRWMRMRIRNRLHAAIFDLGLIVDKLPLKDIDKALAEPDEYEAELGTVPPLLNNLPALVALLYLHNREQEVRAPDRSDGWRTQHEVREGIRLALTRMGVGFHNIDVKIVVERTDSLEELAEKDQKRFGKLPGVFADLLDAAEYEDTPGAVGSTWVQLHRLESRIEALEATLESRHDGEHRLAGAMPRTQPAPAPWDAEDNKVDDD